MQRLKILDKSFGLFLATVLVTLFGISANAQNIQVSGKVTDASGQPIEGVSVYVKGTNTGSITTANGSYSLSVPSNGTLTFNCLGYKEVSQEINGRSVINVTLSEDSQMLEDVVVVGYGTQKKANLTGAVATVDVGKTLESKSTADLGKALQGSVPGLTVINK